MSTPVPRENSSLINMKKHQNLVDHQDSPPAGFGPRFIALILDGIFSQLISSLVIAVLYRDRTSQSPNLSVMLIALEVSLIYTVVPMYAWGQTLGKKVMKVKVVHSETGEHLSLSQILYREYFARFIVAITLGIGYLGVIRRPDKRGLHDFIAHTRVVSLSKGS